MSWWDFFLLNLKGLFQFFACIAISTVLTMLVCTLIEKLFYGRRHQP